jgi:hypothetical protein
MIVMASAVTKGNDVVRASSTAVQNASCMLHSRRNDAYLVDPASSHMLVSKIKPCMSQYILS